MAGTGIGLKGYKSSIGLSRSGETHRTGGQRRRYKNAGPKHMDSSFGGCDGAGSSDKRERGAPVLVWMAIGTVFILTLAAVDYFGAIAIR